MSQFFSLNLMNILNFHTWTIDIYNDLVIFMEVLIAFSTLVFIFISFINKYWMQTVNHWVALELIWTLFPALTLIFLGIPSLKMLYSMEIFNFSSYMSLKVMGHQWYWEYNFSEFMISLMSYPKLINNFIRMGESAVLILPLKCKIRVLVSSYDVLHSWAVPSMGVKMDACPGRLNFFTIMIMQPGKHIGQCSELCGSYHSWMPIFLEITTLSLFFEWIKMSL